MNLSRRQIPPERKALYYGGLLVVCAGFLLFISTFITGLTNFGDFNDFPGQVKSDGFRAFGGMLLIIVGSALSRIGARGWAGAGIILDPEKARKDVEPWSRMAGGVVQDALSETEILKQDKDASNSPAPPVKVRCRNCHALNDEDAKFCDQCGAAM